MGNPPDTWLTDLRCELDRLAAADLLRQLRVVELAGPVLRRDGRELVNLASNDYLGLGTHPRVRQASIDATQRWGTGVGASRLVAGHLPVHQEAEARFAAFKHAEAALLLPSGYSANLAAISALAGPGDLICLDKLNHASLIDAARLSGAEIRIFPHLHYDKLTRLLKTESRRPRAEGRQEEDAGIDPALSPGPSALGPRRSRRFIVTDSVFSMDGEAADLPALCALADEHEAILVVDEAHGTGVLGATGAGLCELQGVAQRVDVVLSTASKALGGLGGIVTGRREVIQTLVNRARPFIFSTGVPAAQAAGLLAALDVLRDEPWRREKLQVMARRVRTQLRDLGWLPEPRRPEDDLIPIIPAIVREARSSLDLAAHLETRGFFAPAIRPPSVPPGAARVRLSLRADLSDADLDRLGAALSEWR